MNRQDRFLALPDNVLFRIFDYHLEFEDTVTVLHVSPTWRNNLLPRLWDWTRIQRYRMLVPLLRNLNDPQLHLLIQTYDQNTPVIIQLHNPRVALINALETFGSRHRGHHIWLNGSSRQIRDNLIALQHRSPRFRTVHVSTSVARNLTRPILDAIVETNFERFVSTGTHFQIRHGRYPRFTGNPQIHMRNIQINGFNGNRIALANYLIARFPNLQMLIVTPPLLMTENPQLVDNIQRPATLLFLVI